MVSHLTVDIFISNLFIAIFQMMKLRLRVGRMKCPTGHQEHEAKIEFYTYDSEFVLSTSRLPDQKYIEKYTWISTRSSWDPYSMMGTGRVASLDSISHRLSESFCQFPIVPSSLQLWTDDSNHGVSPSVIWIILNQNRPRHSRLTLTSRLELEFILLILWGSCSINSMCKSL